jgi:glutathione peroxidase
MKNILLFAFLGLFLSTVCSAINMAAKPVAKSIYNFEVKDIEGKPVKLEIFKGKVLMIANVASKCGFTPQYAGLEKLYKKFNDRGFVVLGFPANNFRNQEPGTNTEIMRFCKSNYGVTFPMFAKISVAGVDKHPLYIFLTEKTTNPEFSGEIRWNFDKFLIDRSGKIIARFDPSEKPEDEKIMRAVEKALE